MQAKIKNEIEFDKDTVIKTFHPYYKPGIKLREEAFRSEVDAYLYFRKIRWAWAPNLKSYDEGRRQVKIQRIKGRSLSEMVAHNMEFSISEVIDQIVELDRLLWINRINCLQIKARDIIIEKTSSKIYMVDFEHTYVKSRYKKILYNQILGPKFLRIAETEMKTKFVSALRSSRKRFYRYRFRMAFIICLWVFRKFILQKEGDEILR